MGERECAGESEREQERVRKRECVGGGGREKER